MTDEDSSGHAVVRWHAHWKVEKFKTSHDPDPYEVIEDDGNLLLYAGASAIWERLIGTSVTAFSNANAQLGVGDSALAVAPTQTGLQGANTAFEGMEATFPQHTDGVDLENSQIVFKSEWGATDGNFQWNEWTLGNGAVFLNRKVVAMGTKTNPEVWTLTVTLGLQ